MKSSILAVCVRLRATMYALCPMLAKTNCLASKACDVDTDCDDRPNITIDKFINIAIVKNSVLNVLYDNMFGIVLHFRSILVSPCT